MHDTIQVSPARGDNDYLSQSSTFKDQSNLLHVLIDAKHFTPFSQ